MSHIPEWLPEAHARHRPLANVARAVGLFLLAAFVVAGALGQVGQNHSERSVSSPEATVTVSAPARIRSGLIDEVRIRVEAHRPIPAPRIHLARGWTDQMTTNTVIPDPDAESWAADGLVLAYGPLRSGDVLEVTMHFQINPTAWGRRDWGVRVQDGERTFADLPRTTFIVP